MAKKKKTLPKNFKELIEAGDIAALKEVYNTCELNAYGGYSKQTAFSFFKVPDELVRWLAEQGADIGAVDQYSRTALHEQSISWCGNIELLIELGADVHAKDYQSDTPLHMAAAFFKPMAAKTLIKHGADINALNRQGQTPLAKALARCDNADIEDMAQVAEVLLSAGTKKEPDMTERVEAIGKNFEFHRAGFNKDYLDSTDLALKQLYKLFGATPSEKRRIHDGSSMIAVSATDWEKQHQELWDFLVPSGGAAETVQGEVIRITGKVSNEILGNGGCNWDADFKKMVDALLIHFASATPLDKEQLDEAALLVKQVRNGDGDSELARLCELAVKWVLQNSKPVKLKKPEYKR